MKKAFSLFGFLSLAVLVLGCQKELAPSGVNKTGKEITLTVKATEGVNTKTYIDGTVVKWATTGEKLKVFEVATPSDGDPETANSTSLEGTTTDEGETMTFATQLQEKDAASFAYYAFYPSGAFASGTSVTSIAINTPGAQTPTATSFDPAADLLIAKSQGSLAAQPSTLEMQFTRAVAVGKMTIKNLASSEPVTKVTFSAKIGENAVSLAGRTAFNLETADVVSSYASNTQETSIILNYSNLSLSASGSTGMTAFFTCYPFAINSSSPGSIKVVVETATQTFTKEVTINSEKGLAFIAGKASVFGVDMNGITGTSKAVDLCYAYLDYNDFTAAGGGTSYGNVTVNKNHGDSWGMYAIGTNNAIGVRRNDGSNANDSYIKLPDFKDNIKTVVVTLKNVTAGKSITLESSATAKDGSIASLTTSTATEYTFDLTDSNVKTAYFRCNGAQALVVKLEVYVGDDTRTAIAAPSTVTATLNSAVNNSIDVEWSAVTGSSGYVITLVPGSGDDVVVNATSSPFTVSDLAYEMDYTVSVQAEPADYYINTISSLKTASSVVTTGAQESGKVTLTSEDITKGDNTAKITVNSLLGYRLGTSSKNGSITIEANNYATISFKAVGWKGKIDSFSISNGTFNNNTSVTPSPNDAATGTINDNASLTINSPYTEVTISVDNPNQDVVITSKGRVIIWGFEATEAVADTRADVTLEFATASYEFIANSAAYNSFEYQTATAKSGGTAVTVGIVYSINDPNSIASGFSASTGAFTLSGNKGTATITASFDGNDDYKPAESVSYSVTVNSENPNIVLSFNFTDLTQFGLDEWPDAVGDNTLTRTYVYNESTNYDFSLTSGIYENSYGYLFFGSKTKKLAQYLGLPTIEGYKLSKVVVTSRSGASASATGIVTSDTEGTDATIEGTQTISTSSTTTWNISSNSNSFYLCSNSISYNAQVTILELTYSSK